MLSISILFTAKDTSIRNDFNKYLISRYPACTVSELQRISFDLYRIDITGLRLTDLCLTFLSGITVHNIRVTEDN